MKGAIVLKITATTESQVRRVLLRLLQDGYHEKLLRKGAVHDGPCLTKLARISDNLILEVIKNV